jgi:hypothetical protein
MIFVFFNEVLATPPLHSHRIKFEALELPCLDLSSLGARFTEDEIWSIIKGLAPDKAPNLDGFTSHFPLLGNLIGDQARSHVCV